MTISIALQGSVLLVVYSRLSDCSWVATWSTWAGVCCVGQASNAGGSQCGCELHGKNSQSIIQM